MALINLLPRSLKKTKPLQKKDIESQIVQLRTGIFSGKFVLITISLFTSILILLFIQGIIKERVLSSLEKKGQILRSDYRKIEGLNKRKKELNDELTFLKGIVGTKILWSEKLYLINQIIPAQVWLTNLSIESKEIKIDKTLPNTENLPEFQTVKNLLIKGSATSLVEAEIIPTITQFVELLRKDTLFSQDFPDLKLDQLQSEKKGNFLVMNFIISGTYTQGQ